MNAVHLIGNITRDIELKKVGENQVVEFSIAINEVWYNQAKEKQERTHFIGCVAWGKLGENIAKYFGKGQRIAIDGSLAQETWEDKESGKKREKTKVRVSSFDFCGGDRKEGASTTATPAARAKAAPDADLDPADEEIPF
jgi:single-strand DNA-binding protein